MENLRDILSAHNSKNESTATGTLETGSELQATTSEIPDLFFDEILVEYKLSRIEIILLMYLYRSTWCKPNLHRKFGIAPILSHADLAKSLDITNEILYHTFRKLESYRFIETIRSGQYFVRKFFTEENDKKYGQTYDDFL